MTDIFDLSLKRNEKEIKECMELSDKLDKLIHQTVKEGNEHGLIALVLADRLGEYLRNLTNKNSLYEIVKKTIERRSGI